MAFRQDGTVGSTLRFEEFFDLEHERLLRALYLVTGDRTEAEDLAQDAFVKVLERWDTVRSMEAPSGYLYRIAMNTFRTRYQRARMAVRRIAMLSRPAVDPFEEVEVQEDLRRSLASLTKRQRAAIVLTELLGYPHEDAGRILGIRASTVRALTTQARATLRSTMEDLDG